MSPQEEVEQVDARREKCSWVARSSALLAKWDEGDMCLAAERVAHDGAIPRLVRAPRLRCSPQEPSLVSVFQRDATLAEQSQRKKCSDFSATREAI